MWCIYFSLYMSFAHLISYLNLRGTTGDPGSENYSVANAQTYIHHSLNTTLKGTQQHKFARHHQNILLEILWSVFHHDFTPGFSTQVSTRGGMTLMMCYKSMSLIVAILSMVTNLLTSLVFQWLAIPWIQAEIDLWVWSRNTNIPWADKHKIPHGHTLE